MKTKRMDNIGFGNLRLDQQPEDFCYGVDAVILAHFAAENSKNSRRIMDLGTGTGVIPLILSHKSPQSMIYGLEVQEESYQLAVRNIAQNRLEDRIQILCGNVKDVATALHPELRGIMDVVVTNPPYMEYNGGIKNNNPAKTIARHEIEGDLTDFMTAAARLLKGKGHLFMVHRPSRLVDLFCIARTCGLEPKEIRFVSPKEGEPANIVLIHLIKGGGKELKVLPPLFVYGTSGEFTDEILEIYEK